jgi:hypothetical protein
MIVDPQTARDLIGLRRFVLAAARRHRVDDDPTIVRAVWALDELERALRVAEYAGPSASSGVGLDWDTRGGRSSRHLREGGPLQDRVGSSPGGSGSPGVLAD